MKRPLPILAALTIAITPPVGAQEALAPGSRIRVATGESPRVVDVDGEQIILSSRLSGKLIHLDEEWLTLESKDHEEPIRVPRRAISTLEVGRGRSRGQGALAGAGIGLLVGVLVGATVDTGCPADPSGRNCLNFAPPPEPTLGILGALVGAAAGTAIGAGTRWEAVEPGGLRLAVGPTRGGAQAQVTISNLPLDTRDERAGSETSASRAPAAKSSGGKRFWFRLPLLSYGGEADVGDFEDGMRRAGLDQPYSPEEMASMASLLAPMAEVFGLSGSLSPVVYPQVEANTGAAQAFAAGFRVRPNLEVQLMLDSSERTLGWGSGHSAYPSAHFDVSKSIRSYAALAAYRRGPARVGLGLSINSVKLEGYGGGGFRASATRPGLTAEVALCLPSDSRFFVDLVGQYRYVPGVKFGAIPVRDHRGGPFTEFPDTGINFSRFTFSFGIGFRI